MLVQEAETAYEVESIFGSGAGDLKHHISNGCNVHDLMNPSPTPDRPPRYLTPGSTRYSRPDPWCLRNCVMLDPLRTVSPCTPYLAAETNVSIADWGAICACVYNVPAVVACIKEHGRIILASCRYAAVCSWVRSIDKDLTAATVSDVHRACVLGLLRHAGRL